MKKMNVQKLSIAGILCGVAVVGSLLSFPVFGSKCAPMQHMVNVLCAVFLGPVYGVSVAFGASFLRNLMGLGSLMAFPGSMFGALLAGITYRWTHRIGPTLLGEVFGTAILGGLSAYPIAILLLGVQAGEVMFYTYILPFFISTGMGAVLAGALIYSLQRTGVFHIISSNLSRGEGLQHNLLK